MPGVVFDMRPGKCNLPYTLLFARVFFLQRLLCKAPAVVV